MVEAVRQGAVLEVILEPAPDAQDRVLNAETRRALCDIFAALAPDLTAVLIRPGLTPFAPQAVLPVYDDTVAPTLATVCAVIEGARVPVTFLIRGQVTGPLAELGLAAHARLSTPPSRISVGAASVGRLLGAGGIGRLAALIGAEQSLRLAQTGVAVTAAEAIALGLVDSVVEGATRVDQMEHARAWVLQGFSRAAGAGLRDGRRFMADVAAARKEAPTNARTAVIDCVEAALLLPRDQRLALEVSLGQTLDDAPETMALCHLYLAEQRAALPLEKPVPIVAHLGLSGAAKGLIGPVLTALARGVTVTVVDPDHDALVSFLRAVAARQEAAVQAGKITEARRDAEWARLLPSEDVAELAPCDLLIAAEGAQVAGEGLVLRTGAGPRPQAEFGLSMARRMAELALPEGADAAQAALATAFLRRTGFMVVITGARGGATISERLSAASDAAVRAMVTLGVPPDHIVAALTGFGLPAPKLAPSPEGPPRRMSHSEIVNRLIAAMANEGVRLLASGKAHSALDVDLVAVRGLGFARDKGGPMHCAAARGLLVVRRDLSLWAPQADVWRPVPDWDRLVAAGRSFAVGLGPDRTLDAAPDPSPDLSPDLSAGRTSDRRSDLWPEVTTE